MHEAKSLIALLHSSDDALLERTLTTIANCSTFTANQVCNHNVKVCGNVLIVNFKGIVLCCLGHDSGSWRPIQTAKFASAS